MGTFDTGYCPTPFQYLFQIYDRERKAVSSYVYNLCD
jgi:hypothetical protein